MSSPRPHAVFLDTSIQVARKIRERPMRECITAWIRGYALNVSSGVVLQEFKNRVLRDVAYILEKLRKTHSYMATLHYITNVLPQAQQRKMRVCLPILQGLLPGATDAELTERARLYCRTLLVYGETEFAREVDTLLSGVDCYWAKTPIREKRPYTSYDLGRRACDKTKGLCRVGDALKAREGRCRALLAFLDALPANRATQELERAREVLRRVIADDFQNAQQENLCSTVGDLLIALESDGIPEMYTMNYRESQAFCDFLNQNVAVRPNDPATPEIRYDVSAKPWPLP